MIKKNQFTGEIKIKKMKIDAEMFANKTICVGTS